MFSDACELVPNRHESDTAVFRHQIDEAFANILGSQQEQTEDRRTQVFFLQAFDNAEQIHDLSDPAITDVVIFSM